ncbi:hypothetical protein SAMN04488523_101146 [Sulfitobacter brevis]|uniref:Arginine transporter n=1 Tax=Sulfitobacter brevis TaxID=74348 RepID=A0A1I1SZX3_9RHOB|nr:hypothetical protein [Sulfitobacter brevis]SFD49503.1 hypothetical protein SAMN04488523_101146 [Sulfitobacter brevis]
MMRIGLACVALLALAACGGGSRGYNPSGKYGSSAVLFAQGPISNACMAGGRKDATRARCGCIQAVADRSMSNSEQRRGAKFFKDPHQAQETRQSSRPGDETFWLNWKEFGNSASTLCAAT